MTTESQARVVHGLTNTLSFILRHPLNRTRKFAALRRFVRWQLGSRLALGSVAVPFVDSTRLLVRPGMTGATQNVYCGLQEFEDMGFVLHALRPGDLFVDVGANIGSYTILAAGASGAHCLSFEPSPTTFVHLLDNIRLNNLESRVTARNVGVGASPGFMTFTSGLDTENHVAAEGEAVADPIEVRVEPLDVALSASPATLLKIDVEGYETEVVNGASDVMRGESLLAVVMELNGSGLRYGYDEEQIHQSMVRWGFEAVRYDPSSAPSPNSAPVTARTETPCTFAIWSVFAIGSAPLPYIQFLAPHSDTGRSWRRQACIIVPATPLRLPLVYLATQHDEKPGSGQCRYHASSRHRTD